MSIGGNDLLAQIENEHPKLGQYLRSYIVPAIQSRGRAGHVLATPTDKPGNVELQPLSSLVSGNNPKSASYVGTDSAGGIVAASTPSSGITQLTGDGTAGPGSGSQAFTLAATGTAGTYTKVTTDSKGRVAAGTSLSAGDIPNISEGQVTGLVADLAARVVNPMTTVGDLIVGGTVSGGVSAPTRLAAGSSGYVLTSGGPGVAPSYQAATGGGAMTKVSETILSSAAASVTFSSIPGGYRHLVIYFQAACDQSSATDGQIYFNGDTGNNYWRSYVLQFANGTIVNGGSTAAGGPNTFSGIAGTSPSHAAASGTITIPNYAGTVFEKYFTVYSIERYSGGPGQGLNMGIWSALPAAITSVTLKMSTGNFVVGSTFSLYVMS